MEQDQDKQVQQQDQQQEEQDEQDEQYQQDEQDEQDEQGEQDEQENPEEEPREVQHQSFTIELLGALPRFAAMSENGLATFPQHSYRETEREKEMMCIAYRPRSGFCPNISQPSSRVAFGQAV